MGLGKSKHSPKSYDIAPVADKEFSYKRQTQPLPKVELPTVVVTTEEDPKADTPSIEEQQPPTEPIAPQQIQTTSLIVPDENITEELPKPQVSTEQPSIPEWINEINFSDLLRQTMDDFQEIIAFQVKPAMSAGENYATLMLRVKIQIKLKNATTKDISYMIKVPHQNDQMNEMLKMMNFFTTENSAYNEILPAFSKLYSNEGSEVRFGPKAYHLPNTTEKNLHVLMEDMGLYGYKNANRLECLDMEHTLIVLRKMAQFHAASAAYVAKIGPFAAQFSPDMDNPFVRKLMNDMFSGFKKPFLDNMKNVKDGEKYYDLMEKFFDNIVDIFVNNRKTMSSYFNVLNHGDSWSNNILFKYNNNGQVEDALYVDFQNPNYGPPSLDLFYFIISSVRLDIKLTHYDYFIHYYHKHLVKELHILKYPLKIPSLKEFHMQMMEFGSWATMTSFLTLGVVLLEPTEHAKFDNFMSNTEEGYQFKLSMYQNPKYMEYITEILPWLYNRGFMVLNEVGKKDFDNVTLPTDKPNMENVTETTAPPATASTSTFSYPEWVNESYFVDILRADIGNYQKIQNFNVNAATNAGDNYSSIMIKVDIDVELADSTIRSVSYMLKIPPAGEEAKSIVTLLNAFGKELTAYNEVLPQLEAIYKEQAGIEVTLAPKSYKPTQETAEDTLILENLRPKGYKNANRLDGLDMQHSKAVLKKMAELHAASAYYYTTKGKFDEKFSKSMYSEDTKYLKEKMGDSYYKLYQNCVEQYSNKDEYIDNVIYYLDNNFDLLIEANRVDYSKFNVLNHGDCWTNNILFQYNDKNELTNTRFVDYQLSKFGTPCQDLYYFILTSPKLDLKVSQFDYFIHYYHENLIKNLEILKYPNMQNVPSLRELHMELLEKGIWAMYTIMGAMSAVLLDPTDSANLESIMSAGEEGLNLKKQMFLNNRYRTHAETIYSWLSKRGALDFVIEKPQPTQSTATPTKKCSIPKWIDKEQFEDVLKKCVENYDSILNINAESATVSGDNYASILLRVKVEAALKDKTTQNTSFIAKLPLESEMERGMIDAFNFFEKETTMYKTYLKEFEKIYENVGEHIKFGPECYELSGDDISKDVILMEDLTQHKFQCGERRLGLDMQHTKCVLKKLAQFHAASVKYMETNGEYPNAFHKGIYTEETRAIFEHLKINFFYDYFERFEGYEEYKDKIPNLLDNHIDHNIRSAKVDPLEFNVLNHGDSWLNNIMFKHDANGNVVETRFVDFQVCKYGPPAQDLWYFLMSSVELGLKVDSYDYLIKYYHNNLMENLRIVNYQGKVPPTLKELHELMLKYSHIGFSTFIGTTAICLVDSKNANLANFSLDTPEAHEFRDALFANERYMAQAAVVLPWMAKRGGLD